MKIFDQLIRAYGKNAKHDDMNKEHVRQLYKACFSTMTKIENLDTIEKILHRINNFSNNNLTLITLASSFNTPMEKNYRRIINNGDEVLVYFIDDNGKLQYVRDGIAVGKEEVLGEKQIIVKFEDGYIDRFRLKQVKLKMKKREDFVTKQDYRAYKREISRNQTEIYRNL